MEELPDDVIVSFRCRKAVAIIKPLNWYKPFAAEVKTLLKSRGVGLETVGLAATKAGK
jgi:hypothetical protein